MIFGDLTNVATGSFSALPEGYYNVFIEGAEVKKSKESNNEGLSVKFKIISDTGKNRVFFKWLTMEKQSNPQGFEKAQKFFARLLEVIGIPPNNYKSTDLIGKKLRLFLKVDDKKENYIAYCAGLESSTPGNMPAMITGGSPAPDYTPSITTADIPF